MKENLKVTAIVCLAYSAFMLILGGPIIRDAFTIMTTPHFTAFLY